MRLNSLANVGEFLVAWDKEPAAAERPPVVLHKTIYGNVNNTGQLGNYSGHAVSRWSPQFAESIETGVREFVCVLALEFNWITFSSCEGHSYPEARLEPTERYVGLLARDPRELAHLERTLAHVCTRTAEAAGVSPVALVLTHEPLSADGNELPTVVFRFARGRSASFPDYFSDLERVYAIALRLLKAEAREAGPRGLNRTLER